MENSLEDDSKYGSHSEQYLVLKKGHFPLNFNLNFVDCVHFCVLVEDV